MSKEKSRATEFSCHVPDARAVFLAGTFNDWQKDATPMKKGAKGTWKANLELPSGRREFKFVVDGQGHGTPEEVKQLWLSGLRRAEASDAATDCHTSSAILTAIPNSMNRLIEVTPT